MNSVETVNAALKKVRTVRQERKLTPKEQGDEFEAEVATALRELRDSGAIKDYQNLTSMYGHPADYLVYSSRSTDLIECKSLIENRINRPNALLLRHITPGEWASLRGWQSKAACRRAWVVWKIKLLSGEYQAYAVPFEMLDRRKKDGGGLYFLHDLFVVPVWVDGKLDLLKLYEGALE